MALRGSFALRQAVLTALTVASCAAGAAASAQTASRDSAGIEIVETPGAEARRASRISVRSEPELQIGLLDGAAPYLFSVISGVALLEDGRIAVLDSESAELRFYDRGGRFLGRSGGPGEGPGEFMRPLLLNAMSEDSLVIVNVTMGSRLTVYSSDGEAYRTLSWDPYALGQPLAMWGDRAIARTFDGGWRQGGPEGLFPRNELTLLVDRRRLVVDTLASASAPLVVTNVPGSGPYIDRPPFAFETASAVGEDGFFITSPHDPSILVYSWEGELRRIVRVLEASMRVTEEELVRAIDRRVESLPAPMKPAFERVWGALELGMKPAFQRLIVDPDGWLWAQSYQGDFTTNALGIRFPDATTTWLVFDPSGRGRGSVELPEGLSVQDISSDFVAGIWRDEYDVEYVRLFRIDGR